VRYKISTLYLIRKVRISATYLQTTAVFDMLSSSESSEEIKFGKKRNQLI